MEEFIENAPLVQSRRVFARLRRRFAAVYAGTVLAIDYDILPTSKKASLRDLRKCMNDAINLLIENEGTGAVAPSLSEDDLTAQFRGRLIGAKFIKAGAYAQRARSLTVKQIEAADGYINYIEPRKYRVMLQTHRMLTWYPDEANRNRLVKLLRSRKIFLVGRQADTCSRQVKFKPYPNKISAYWLSLKALGLTKEDLQVS